MALARDRQRGERQSGQGLLALFVVLVLAWLGIAISEFAAGRFVSAAFFALVFVSGVGTLVLRYRRRGCAALAEQRNRQLLERLGRPYASASDDVLRPPLHLVLLGTGMLLVYYVVAFGALTRLMDGLSLTVFGVLSRGWLFGVLLSIANLTWVSRRNDRAAAGPGDPAATTVPGDAATDR